MEYFLEQVFGILTFQIYLRILALGQTNAYVLAKYMLLPLYYVFMDKTEYLCKHSLFFMNLYYLCVLSKY